MPQSTRPVLGYITELWTPPASCLSVEVYSTTPPWNTGYQGVTCTASGCFYDSTDCWPPRTANAHHPTGAFLRGWGFYSPGTVCPSGFTTACVTTYGQPVSGWPLQFTLTSYWRNGCRMLSEGNVFTRLEIIGKRTSVLTIFVSPRRIHLPLLASECRRE